MNSSYRVLAKIHFSLLFLVLTLACSCARWQAASGSAQPAQSSETASVTARQRPASGEIPRRIVSLSPAVTEILFAIGAGDSVVGVTQYCDYPPEAAARTSVGGFSGATISVEQIRALNPDLVILSGDMHTRIVSLLDELDIPSVAVEPRNFSEVYDVIALLGKMTGCESGAETVIAGMKEKIARVEAAIQGRERPGVFWILGEDPLMSVGSGTFVSEAIALAGGRNIFEDVREQWPLVSPEQVLIRMPEWIFMAGGMAGSSPVSGTPGVFSSSLFQQSFWQTLSAVKEGRVAVVNGDILYRYGPRLADAVVSLAKILHAGL